MPRIEIGNKVTIGARSGYLAVNPYTSGVGEILNDHTFLIYVPIINGDAVMFPVNSSFLFVFYTEGGLYQADGKVLEHCVQNKVTLMKIEVGTFEHTQRRDFYRVNVNMPLTYTRMSEAQIAETEKKPIYKGVAKNISGGGLCFTTNTQLSPGEHILCNLTLDGMPTSVEAEVLSVEPYDNDKNARTSRLKFVNIDHSRQDEITRYVFKIESGIIFKKRLESEIKSQP